VFQHQNLEKNNMSVDVGLIVRKHKRGCSFYEVCLSTRHRTYLETMPKGFTEKDIQKRIKELDKELASSCGAYYEAIFYEDYKTSRDPELITNKAIKAIKTETAQLMQKIINKAKKSLKIKK